MKNSLLIDRAAAYGSPPSRIVVSAPRGTAPGGVPNTGLVYSCPVNPGSCSALPGKLYDTTRESVYYYDKPCMHKISQCFQIVLRFLHSCIIK